MGGLKFGLSGQHIGKEQLVKNRNCALQYEKRLTEGLIKKNTIKEQYKISFK